MCHSPSGAPFGASAGGVAGAAVGASGVAADAAHSTTTVSGNTTATTTERADTTPSGAATPSTIATPVNVHTARLVDRAGWEPLAFDSTVIGPPQGQFVGSGMVVLNLSNQGGPSMFWRAPAALAP